MRHPLIVPHHSGPLPAVDVTRVGAIPVTTVARTIIDLAGALPADAVEENLDYALSHGYVPGIIRRLEGRLGGSGLSGG